MLKLPAINRNLGIYIGKCLVGCLLSFAVEALTHYNEVTWFMLSILLVLSPAREEAMKLTVTRINATLVGGISSLIFLAFGLHAEFGILGAVTLTIILCALFEIMDVTRPALATVVVLMLRQPGAHLWDAVIARLIAVIGGCLAGLAITYLFHIADKNPPPDAPKTA